MAISPEKDEFTRLAEQKLQRTATKPIENEVWAQQYVQKMKEQVIQEKQNNRGWVGFLFRTATDEDIEKRERISAEQDRIRKEYQDASRMREAEKIAREKFQKLKYYERISPKEQENYISKLQLIEYNYINLTEISPGANLKAASAKVAVDEAEVFKDIESKINAKDFDDQLVNVEKIAIEKLNKISGYKILPLEDQKSYTSKLARIEYDLRKSSEGQADYPGLQEAEKKIFKEVNKKIYHQYAKDQNDFIKNELKQYSSLAKFDMEIKTFLSQEFKDLIIAKAILKDEIEKFNNNSSEIAKELVLVEERLSTVREVRFSEQSLAFVPNEKDEQAFLDNLDYKVDHWSEWKKNTNKMIDGIPGIGKIERESRERFFNETMKLEERRSKFKGGSDQEEIPFLRWFVQPSEEANKFKERDLIIADYNKVLERIQKNIDLEFEKEAAVDLAKYSQLSEISEAREKPISDDLEYGAPEGIAKDLKEALKKELFQALVNKRRINEKVLPIPSEIPPEEELKLVDMKIKLAEEFSAIPLFREEEVEDKEKLLEKKMKLLTITTKCVMELSETRNKIKAIEQKLQTEKVQEARDPLIKALDNARNVEKEQIKEIKGTVSAIFKYKNFSKEDTEFEAKEHRVSDAVAYGKQKVKDFWDNPKVQGALIAGLLGAAAGSYIPLYGTASGGLIGAYTGYNNPGVSRLLRPFRFLYNEIEDIIFKPKSYIDRIFRGGTMVGTTVGVVSGMVVLTALLGNPFTAVPLVGAVVGIVGTALIVAGAAKLAKVISKKVSEKIYGISDPDRYTLTDAAKKLFGVDLNKLKKGGPNATPEKAKLKEVEKIQEYFKQEIRSIQKRIEKNPDKQSDKARNLLARLVELETAWEKLQSGSGEFLEAWKNYSRHLYQAKKNEYVKNIKTNVKNHQNDITDILLNITADTPKPMLEKQEDRITIEPKVFVEKAPTNPTNNPKHLSFLYESNKKPKKILHEIEKLKDINKDIKNLIIQPAPEKPKPKPDKS